eukprot:TRINITY_DN40951_c0_g1_i1.p1 TRINITY_DN40951_c0_g1~~TRINITY_DN40951_c0_g1_i1.p1  ORF type:complete len:179 (-),score=45.23 TRINITY_DN40951_c0_g1_i1:24-536(-)
MSDHSPLPGEVEVADATHEESERQPEGDAEFDAEEEEEDEEDEDSDESDTVETKRPATIKFRSYIPRDDNLRAKRVKRKRVFETVNEDDGKEEEEHEKLVEDQVRDLLPKKRNHDLKTSLAPRLDILKQRTQRVIFQLIKDKLVEEDEEDEVEEDVESGSDAEQVITAEE